MRFGDETSSRVPQQRIIQKMDDYMSRRDYQGAERHLLYWLEEALLTGDKRGELMLRNELVGHYRKTGQKDKALASGREALRLIEELGFEGTISAGTTYVNIGTAMNAFGEDEASLALFEKAREVYENSPSAEPQLLGGLYNNMALSCSALGRYAEAFTLYGKAMEQMAEVPGGELEQAITLLNMAETVEKEQGMEKGEQEIFGLLERAQALLAETKAPRNGYYAFVCEKCAPSFAYYGFFAAAQELQETAERIYRENRDEECG